jgi:hypothetical protein
MEGSLSSDIASVASGVSATLVAADMGTHRWGCAVVVKHHEGGAPASVPSPTTLGLMRSTVAMSPASRRRLPIAWPGLPIAWLPIAWPGLPIAWLPIAWPGLPPPPPPLSPPPTPPLPLASSFLRLLDRHRMHGSPSGWMLVVKTTLSPGSKGGGGMGGSFAPSPPPEPLAPADPAAAAAAALAAAALAAAALAAAALAAATAVVVDARREGRDGSAGG